MNRQTWTLCAVLAAVVAFASAAVGAEAEQTDKAPAQTDEAKGIVLTGENAVMAREVDLNEEQKAKLVKTVDEAREVMTAWEKANREKVEAFQQAVAAARQSQDPAAFKKALDDARPMLKEQQALQMKYHEAIMGILTPEQRAKWIGFALWRDLTAQCKPLNLTDEQIAKARTLCDTAAKELAALPAIKEEDEAGLQARQAVHRKLVSGFVANVLTDAQRAAVRPPGQAAPDVSPAPGAADAPPASK